jgi:hypothetical protein
MGSEAMETFYDNAETIVWFSTGLASRTAVSPLMRLS